MSSQVAGPLVLANHGDFNGQCMDARFSESERKIWYAGSAELLDHALFWAEGNALVVVPEDLNPAFLKDAQRFFGTEAIDVLKPDGEGRDLCERIGQDPDTSERVEHHLRQATQPEILAWGMTPSLGAFVRQKTAEGHDLRMPTIPAPDALWVVQLLDSKPGFRLLAEDLSCKHAQVLVPEGLILPDLESALAAAQDYFFLAGDSVVLKAARGTGGYSTLVCMRPDNPKEQIASLRRAGSLARFNTFWEVGSVVAERFVTGVSGGVPAAFTIDACVAGDGAVSVECVGRMLIRDGARYDGAVIGRGAVEPVLIGQIGEVAQIFGRALAERSFAGLFDLDFVVDEDGRPWVCEMNVRRASPSHLQSIARRVFGWSWATRGAVFGRDYVHVRGALKLGYEDIRRIAADFRSRSSATLELLITQASRSLLRSSPHFGYAIVADDAQTCAEEADRFERFLYAALGLNLGALAANRG